MTVRRFLVGILVASFVFSLWPGRTRFLYASAEVPRAENESYEHIVARAHQYDARAMLLTALGYAMGVSGFPKEPHLARAWAQRLPWNGKYTGATVVGVLTWKNEPRPEASLGHRIRECEFLLNASLGTTFSPDVVSAVGAACAEIEAQKSVVRGWKKQYDNAKPAGRAQQEIVNAMRIMREIGKKPVSAREDQDIAGMLSRFPPEMLLFSAATTHNPLAEPPNWDDARLIDLLDAFQEAANGKATLQKTFEPAIVATITGKLAGCPPESEMRKLIRSAHMPTFYWNPSTMLSGQAGMRAMFRHYQGGTCGFPHSPELAEAWLLSAALTGDPYSQLELAIVKYGNNALAEAWFWSEIAGKDARMDDRNRRTAAALAARTEGDGSLATEESALLEYYLDFMKAHTSSMDVPAGETEH